MRRGSRRASIIDIVGALGLLHPLGLSCTRPNPGFFMDGGTTGGEGLDGPAEAGDADEAGATGDGDGDGDGDGSSGEVSPDCTPLSVRGTSSVIVTPQDASDLGDIVAGLEPNTEVLFEPGTYDVSGWGGTPIMFVQTDGTILRAKNGDPQSVILDAGWSSSFVIKIAANDVVVTDLTVVGAGANAVFVEGNDSRQENTQGTIIYRTALIDSRQAGIQVEASPGYGFYSDAGTIACNTIEMTEVLRSDLFDECFAGGIDIATSAGWRVADNDIAGFWCENGLASYGIVAAEQSRDTLIERNWLFDCARGIRVGDQVGAAGDTRPFPNAPNCADDPGAYVGHYGGVVRNNMVSAGEAVASSGPGFEEGIALWSACDVHVLHNTVASTAPPFASIDYRFSTTSVTLQNNLASHNIQARDSAVLVDDSGNHANWSVDAFVDVGSGDLHLQDGTGLVDMGINVAGTAPLDDFDAEARSDGMPDIGADEL